MVMPFSTRDDALDPALWAFCGGSTLAGQALRGYNTMSDEYKTVLGIKRRAINNQTATIWVARNLLFSPATPWIAAWPI